MPECRGDLERHYLPESVRQLVSQHPGRGGGGGGGTPIYFLVCRDVPPVRVSFSGFSVLNRVYDFTFLCLKQGIQFHSQQIFSFSPPPPPGVNGSYTEEVPVSRIKYYVKSSPVFCSYVASYFAYQSSRSRCVPIQVDVQLVQVLDDTSLVWVVLEFAVIHQWIKQS